jgi:hypothetical protein
MVERVGVRVNRAGICAESGYPGMKRKEEVDFKCLQGPYVEVLRAACLRRAGKRRGPQDDNLLFCRSSKVFILPLITSFQFVAHEKTFEVALSIGLTSHGEIRNKSGLTLLGGSGQMKVWLLQDEMRLAENRPTLYGHC